jgi:hypothetical protein
MFYNKVMSNAKIMKDIMHNIMLMAPNGGIGTMMGGSIMSFTKERGLRLLGTGTCGGSRNSKSQVSKLLCVCVDVVILLHFQLQ